MNTFRVLIYYNIGGPPLLPLTDDVVSDISTIHGPSIWLNDYELFGMKVYLND